MSDQDIIDTIAEHVRAEYCAEYLQREKEMREMLAEHAAEADQ